MPLIEGITKTRSPSTPFSLKVKYKNNGTPIVRLYHQEESDSLKSSPIKHRGNRKAVCREILHKTPIIK